MTRKTIVIPARALDGETPEQALSRVMKEFASKAGEGVDLAAYARIESYKETQLHLREALLELPVLDPSKTPIRHDPKKVVDPETLRQDADRGLLELRRALASADRDRLSAAAAIFTLAALELAEFFALEGVTGLKLALSPDELDDEPEQDDWPTELWMQLNEEEKRVVRTHGITVEGTSTEEQQPYCDAQPCLGCDLRKKVNAFRQLEAAQRARPH